MPKKARLERERQVHHIIKTVPSKKFLNALGDPRKLPLIGLAAATQRYVVGAFEDCILHSALSVELALLLKLDEKLGAKEKGEIKKNSGLTFGKTIKLAKDKQILDKDSADKVWVLFNFRNMFAHPANWVSFIKRQTPEAISEMLPKIAPEVLTLSKGIEDIAEKKGPQLQKRLNKMKRSIVGNRISKIPSLEWTANQGTLIFQEKDSKSYYVPLVRDFLEPRNFRLFINKDNFIHHLQERYLYLPDITFKALTTAFDILKQLDFLIFEKDGCTK